MLEFLARSRRVRLQAGDGSDYDMGFLRALHSIVNPRVLGEETVEAQFNTYRILANRNPNAEPHELLAQTLLGRWNAQGKNVGDQTIQLVALSETMQFACLQPPSCVKALGLYILYRENPQIIERHAQFAVDFDVLMRPVQAAQANGSLEALYRSVNPRMAANGRTEGLAGTPERLSQAPAISVFPLVNDSSTPRTALDEAREVGGQLLIRGYRTIGALRECAPTEKTSDVEILAIYEKVITQFRSASINRGEHLPVGNLNYIVLKFLHVNEMLGPDALNDHLTYEVEKYRREGLRDDYRRNLDLL